MPHFIFEQFMTFSNVWSNDKFCFSHFAKGLMQLLQTADVINLKVEDVRWNIARVLIQNSKLYSSVHNPFLYKNA